MSFFQNKDKIIQYIGNWLIFAPLNYLQTPIGETSIRVLNRSLFCVSVNNSEVTTLFAYRQKLQEIKSTYE